MKIYFIISLLVISAVACSSPQKNHQRNPSSVESFSDLAQFADKGTFKFEANDNKLVMKFKALVEKYQDSYTGCKQSGSDKSHDDSQIRVEVEDNKVVINNALSFKSQYDKGDYTVRFRKDPRQTPERTKITIVHESISYNRPAATYKTTLKYYPDTDEFISLEVYSLENARTPKMYKFKCSAQ